MMCNWGTSIPVEVTIPASLSFTGKDRREVKLIDSCIAGLVEWLDKHGYKPINSCCGHGNGPAIIILVDGKQVIIPN